jgi:hypothetical protein
MKLTNKSLYLSLIFLTACAGEIGNSQSVATVGTEAYRPNGRYCNSAGVQYSERFRSFGIPHVPVGIPLGSKRLVVQGKVIAEKEFFVENSDDVTIYTDWDIEVTYSTKKMVWSINQGPVAHTVFTATMSAAYKDGTPIVVDEDVVCDDITEAVP